MPSHLFPPKDVDIWVTDRGTLIMIFDPNAAEGSPPLWEWTKETEYGTGHVPKGCRIKILHGWVTMSTSAERVIHSKSRLLTYP